MRTLNRFSAVSLNVSWQCFWISLFAAALFELGNMATASHLAHVFIFLSGSALLLSLLLGLLTELLW